MSVNTRRQRLCRCVSCSKHPLGYLSVSYTTFTRHNPPGKPVAAPPARPLRASSSINRSPSPAPVQPERVDWSDDDFGEPNDFQLDPGGLPEHRYDELGDVWNGEDNSYVDSQRSGGSSQIDVLGDQQEEEQWWDPDELSDDEEEEEPVMQTGPVLRHPPQWLNRHHSLDPSLRHLYTSIAYGKATGMSVAAADSQLDTMTRALELERGEAMEERTAKVKTALSRIGVNPDESIDRRIVCPKFTCWHMTPYKLLYDLDSPACPECGTDMFKQVNHLRTPFKVIPYTKLSTTLPLLLQNEDTFSRLQHWREDSTLDTGQPAPVFDIEEPLFDRDTPLRGLSHGSAWRSYRKNYARWIEEDFSVVEEPVPGRGDYSRHSSDPLGLFIIINCDWFAVKGVIGSSVGAIYATIANLPRDIAFKKRNTTLLCVIPGPREPGPDCLAKVLQPIVDDLQQCERGVSFYRGPADERTRYTLSARVLLFASDLLAAKKLIGTVSHASKSHPCHQCAATLSEVNQESGYNWREFQYYPSAAILRHAFEYERATRERRLQIEEDCGVRFSPLLRLLGVDHANSSPVDGLHNSFLGIAKSFVNMLFSRRLFSPSVLDDYLEDEVDEEERIARFCSVFENANYPGHLGRLPARITRQFATDRDRAGSGLKADQWKRIVQLLPVAMFMAFKGDLHDDIPDIDLDDRDEPDAEGEIDIFADRPTLHGGLGLSQRQRAPKPKPKTKKRGKKARRSDQSRTSNEGDDLPDAPPDKPRNRADWFRIAVSVCSGLSILHAHSLSISEAETAVDDLAGAAKAILANGGRLTINWHIAMHYPETVKRFGPLSGYATWAFERNNGSLSRVKHNGQERDLPTTLLRSWNLELYLAGIINNPAPDATELELEGLRALVADRERARGTLMLEECRGVAANRTIRLPTPFQKNVLVDLVHYGCYRPLLQFLSINYPDIGFVDDAFWDAAEDQPALPRRSTAYSVYSHAIFNGFKFCSSLWSRGRRDMFALAVSNDLTGRRDLCKLHLILKVTMTLRLNGDRVHIDQTLALVQFYSPTEGNYPWESRDIDLGIRIYRDEPLETCFIPLEHLEASTIVCPINTQQDGPCLVSVSCDREGPEPEHWLENDQEMELVEDVVLDDI